MKKINASDARIFINSIRNEKINIEYTGDDLINLISYLTTLSSDNNKIMMSEYYYSKLKSLKLNNIDTLFGIDVIVIEYLYDEEIIFYNNVHFETYYDPSENPVFGTYYQSPENIIYYNSKNFLREQKLKDLGL